MGTGGSQEAEFALIDDVPAGTYTLVADGIIINSVDVTFELIWRHGALDLPLAMWNQHFDPRGGGDFRAQAYEVEAEVGAIDYEPGDLLVLRYTGVNGSSPMSYVPNGDGAEAEGRIPHLILPP